MVDRLLLHSCQLDRLTAIDHRFRPVATRALEDLLLDDIGFDNVGRDFSCTWDQLTVHLGLLGRGRVDGGTEIQAIVQGMDLLVELSLSMGFYGRALLCFSTLDRGETIGFLALLIS